ncbi:hypothetical protein [Sporolactobacillus terrae]|uniref:hypothetical protein n=1 Tax=Sporolactobacillus terrae TaxID=269673 RepID=UPI00159BB2F5|nr:hypothetical protein [Sporolactobacillus terrae]
MDVQKTVHQRADAPAFAGFSTEKTKAHYTWMEMNASERSYRLRMIQLSIG